jgi:hypothetical protein
VKRDDLLLPGLFWDTKGIKKRSSDGRGPKEGRYRPIRKGALIQAGASEWSIYTKRELRQLIAQNRIAPISADELRKLHEIKRTFGVRLTE